MPTFRELTPDLLASVFDTNPELFNGSADAPLISKRDEIARIATDALATIERPSTTEQPSGSLKLTRPPFQGGWVIQRAVTFTYLSGYVSEETSEKGFQYELATIVAMVNGVEVTLKCIVGNDITLEKGRSYKISEKGKISSVKGA